MQVHFSTHFHEYTGPGGTVNADGRTLAEVLADVERQHPGLRFRFIDEQGRVRRHVKVFVNLTCVEDLGTPVGPADEVHVLGALSGG